MIHCCKCGSLTAPRMLNMCEMCLSMEIDLATNVKRWESVDYCKKCDRYLSPPKTWKHYAPGSDELLLFILKKNKSLSKLSVSAASFGYTEEHSKRLLIDVAVREGGFEQSFQIKVVLRHTQCQDCAMVEAKQYWQSKVQVRQKVKQKRTFMYLEQAILKHSAHRDTINIKEIKDGLDFYFQTKSNALKFVSFLQKVIGVRVKHSSKLISQDIRSNLSFFKNTFSVEIFPFCKDDIVFFEEEVASKLSMGRIGIVLRVSTSIRVIDPVSLKTTEIGSKYYWANCEKLHVLASSPQLKRYIVAELRKHDERNAKYLLADVFVTKDGSNTTHCKSHLGNILKEGDVVLGYNLSSMNIALSIESDYDTFLIRKEVVRQKKLRVKTKHEKDEEYSLFIGDVVDDNEMAQLVNVYDEEDNVVLNFRDLAL